MPTDEPTSPTDQRPTTTDGGRLRVAVVTLEKVHTSLAGAAWLQFPRVLQDLEEPDRVD
ncbi:MAG: hypothetical protein R2706_07690 [Acidimicrobiales bacterium]